MRHAWLLALSLIGCDAWQEVNERFALPDPLSLFDAQYFVSHPLALCLVAKSLLPAKHTPTASHRFVKALEARGQLLASYSENVDGLEAAAGVQRTVACHGTAASATCLACKSRVAIGEIRAQLEAETPPRCAACSHPLNFLKPDLGCYGEQGVVPDIDAMLRQQLAQAEVLVVLGAGLRAPPLASIPAALRPGVPQILIGPEAVWRPPPITRPRPRPHALATTPPVTLDAARPSADRPRCSPRTSGTCTFRGAATRWWRICAPRSVGTCRRSRRPPTARPRPPPPTPPLRQRRRPLSPARRASCLPTGTSSRRVPAPLLPTAGTATRSGRRRRWPCTPTQPILSSCAASTRP